MSDVRYGAPCPGCGAISGMCHCKEPRKADSSSVLLPPQPYELTGAFFTPPDPVQYYIGALTQELADARAQSKVNERERIRLKKGNAELLRRMREMEDRCSVLNAAVDGGDNEHAYHLVTQNRNLRDRRDHQRNNIRDLERKCERLTQELVDARAQGVADERERVRALALELGDGMRSNAREMYEAGDTEDGEWRCRQWVGMEFASIAEMLWRDQERDKTDALMDLIQNKMNKNPPGHTGAPPDAEGDDSADDGFHDGAMRSWTFARLRNRIRTLLEERKATRGECDRLEEQLAREREHLKKKTRYHDQAYHALVVAGFPTHADLNACGCQTCEEIRAVMIDTGFLDPAKESP